MNIMLEENKLKPKFKNKLAQCNLKIYQMYQWKDKYKIK